MSKQVSQLNFRVRVDKRGRFVITDYSTAVICFRDRIVRFRSDSISNACFVSGDK